MTVTASLQPESDGAETHNATTIYDELVSFLTDQKLEVREKASEAVLSLSEDAGFILACQNSELFSQRVGTLLLRGLGVSKALSFNSCGALANLSRQPSVGTALLEANAIRLLMDNLKDQQRQQAPQHAALNLICLANLTRHEKGPLLFLGLKDEDQDTASILSELFLGRLIQLYLQAPSRSTDGQFPDEYIFVGHILVNITRLAAGRYCLLNKKSSVEAMETASRLSRLLLPASPSFSVERRTVMLQVIRHLAADRELHKVLSLSLLPRALCCLVYPPRGSSLRKLQQPPPLPEQGGIISVTDAESCYVAGANASRIESDKERPVDSFIDEHACGLIECLDSRQQVVDSIELLLVSPECREALRQLQAYNVLRIWHIIESDHEIRLRIENMVHLLVYTEEELAEQDKSIRSSEKVSAC